MLMCRGNILGASPELSDIITEIQRGDDGHFDMMVDAYKPLMLSLVNRYFGDRQFPQGLEYDDLLQEASMALYKAAKRYDLNSSGVTFGLYAKICIKNKFISIKRKQRSEMAKQQKAAAPEAHSRDRSRFSASGYAGIGRDKLEEAASSCLTDLEMRVFRLYSEELSYKEISDRLNISVKSADNAIYRIKCKLKKYLIK